MSLELLSTESVSPNVEMRALRNVSKPATQGRADIIESQARDCKLTRRLCLFSSLFSSSSSTETDWVWAVWETACCAVFQATCGRVLCVHRRGTVHTLFGGCVSV